MVFLGQPLRRTRMRLSSSWSGDQMHPSCTDTARSSAKDAKGFKLEDLVALSIVLSNLDVVI
jgi:hypothetical protein